MIKSRLEAKALRIWLFCIVLFISAALVASWLIGFFTEEKFYNLFPFLNFDLNISGSLFGINVPTWLSENFSFLCTLLCVIGVLALAAHLIYVIVLNILRLQRRKAAKTLRRTGYSKEYFDILENKRRHLSGSALGAQNDLCIAKAYCEGRRYDDAFAVLRDIDLDRFDAKLAAKYYNLYTYLFLLTGDISSAKSTVELGEPFCKKFPNMPEYRLNAALLKYADKDFYAAKTAFEELLDCKNVETRVWAALYLGLVYLRLRKKELARKLAGTLGNYKKTPRQSEDMIKLLKKIETAYALEEQEKLESSSLEASSPEAGSADVASPEAGSTDVTPAEAEASNTEVLNAAG